MIPPISSVRTIASLGVVMVSSIPNMTRPVILETKRTKQAGDQEDVLRLVNQSETHVMKPMISRYATSEHTRSQIQ